MKPLITFEVPTDDTHGEYHDLKPIEVSEPAKKERIFTLKIGSRSAR